MAVIALVTHIAAPVERVFDLTRCIELHLDSASTTSERAVAGVTSGLIGPGQEVTWRARHFGVWQTLTVRISAFERPTYFADVMVRGAFRQLEHHHFFERTPTGTTMRDDFRFASPYGLFGRLADALFLKRYLQVFLTKRNRVIKATAESDAWKRYLVQA